MIGGSSPAARNLISGNSRASGAGVGVEILGAHTAGTMILGNDIGTDRSGERALGNNVGVFLNGVSGVTVGGTAAGSGNLISGNQNAGSGVGVYVSGPTATGDVIAGNRIGTDALGKRAMVGAESDLGVLVSDSGGNIRIGGTTAGARNVISGFRVGVEIYAPVSTFNPVKGEHRRGRLHRHRRHRRTRRRQRYRRLRRRRAVQHDRRPDPGLARRDLPATASGSTSSAHRPWGNLIQGNDLGLDASGKLPLGNHTGIALDAASRNTVTGDVIAGNVVEQGEGSIGIYLLDAASNNTITANLVGTDAQGKPGKGFGQGDYGVLLFNASNNAIARSVGTNKIVGSGIANVREFTGATTTTTTATVAKSVRKGPRGPVALAVRRA